MCCMVVAMIYVGAIYEDDVLTYLIVGGIFVLILYILPLLSVSVYIKEAGNGEKFWFAVPFLLPFCFPLLVFIVALLC